MKSIVKKHISENLKTSWWIRSRNRTYEEMTGCVYGGGYIYDDCIDTYRGISPFFVI